MKKVLICVLALGMFAAPAFASTIKDSKHDLSMDSDALILSDNHNELCVFCHTPHQASTSVTLAPLWNRTTDGNVSNLEVEDLYDSASLSPASAPNADLLLAIQQSDAPLCLSCHDGSNMAGGIKNLGNIAGPVTFVGGVSAIPEASRANIMNDSMLKDDHPIGMVYADVVTAKPTDFNAASPEGKIGTQELPLFDGRMWCASCHAVHGVADVPSFLRASNNQSDLCLQCHNK